MRWLPPGAEARVRISVLDGALLRPRGLGQDRRGTQSPPALPCVLWYMFGRLGGVSVLLGSVESVRGRRAKGSLARRTGSVLASLSQGRRAHSTRGEGSRFFPTLLRWVHVLNRALSGPPLLPPSLLPPSLPPSSSFMFFPDPLALGTRFEQSIAVEHILPSLLPSRLPPPLLTCLLRRSFVRASLPPTPSLFLACQPVSYLAIPGGLRSAKLSPLSMASGGSSGVTSYADSN